MCVTRSETEPQALMQTPCRAFLQGAAKFALHEKARSAPASVGSTKNGKMQSTLSGGVRDASGNRAAGALMQTPCRIFCRVLRNSPCTRKRGAHPRALVAHRTAKCKALCMAECGTRAETEPQALMQTPCRVFLQGVAKFALRRGGGEVVA